MTRRLIFDLESDNLYWEATKVHCIVLRDIDSEETLLFGPDEIPSALREMEDSLLLVAHNGISFDFPLLQRLYGWTVDRSKVFDTLVASQLICTDLFDKDLKYHSKHYPEMPKKLMGKHKLEAWGHRLFEHKGDFKDFSEFSQEMMDYCAQDTLVTLKLYKLLEAKKYSKTALWLEHNLAWVLLEMHLNGFHFDVEGGKSLYAELLSEKVQIERQLQEVFPPIITERISEKTGKVLKPNVEVFNPGSRQQISKRLKAKYGWVSPEVTKKAQEPKIDEDILKEAGFPETDLLARYFILQKVCSMLAEGDNSWIKLERSGKIHGSILGNGAVTGRATHFKPNMGQIPGCSAEYGVRCRTLFYAPSGWTQVGTDASGLELRCLGHFMASYDGGKYSEIVVSGDVHTANQLALGFPEGPENRPKAKTFIYAFLYGAWDTRLGSIIGGGAPEGGILRNQFLSSFPALSKLQDALEAVYNKRGFIYGLDGRILHVRSVRAILNTLLQSAGALICKYWVVMFYKLMLERGYKHGWDGDFAMVAWVHDEMQIMARTKEIAEEIKEVSHISMKKAEEFFKFKCPLDVDSKTGFNWAQTH